MTSSVVSVASNIVNIFNILKITFPNITFHQAINLENDQQIQKSHIIIADYDLIGPYIYNLPRVKWVQGTWAGIDALLPYINSNESLHFPITRFTGNHFGRLIGEDCQIKHQWCSTGKIHGYRSIYDLTIGVLGIGNIGDRIARLLNYMGATVLGLGRRDVLDITENKHISQYFNINRLTEFLQNCDYIINTLPNTRETKGLLNGRILENCKDKNAVFVNVGRGSIISEESLVKALQEKWISGAVLDVFDNEPLKKESSLWKMENVFISPHVSGVSRAKDIVDQFRENLIYYEKGLPIPGTVDFSKGY